MLLTVCYTGTENFAVAITDECIYPVNNGERNKIDFLLVVKQVFSAHSEINNIFAEYASGRLPFVGRRETLRPGEKINFQTIIINFIKLNWK